MDDIDRSGRNCGGAGDLQSMVTGWVCEDDGSIPVPWGGLSGSARKVDGSDGCRLQCGIREQLGSRT